MRSLLLQVLESEKKAEAEVWRKKKGAGLEDTQCERLCGRVGLHCVFISSPEDVIGSSMHFLPALGPVLVSSRKLAK